MDFTLLFNPKTIAVLGVSLTNDRHPANVIYNKILLRYPVKVYPVNPKASEILGLPAFRSVTEIPDPVALAVVVTRHHLHEAAAAVAADIHEGSGAGQAGQK